MRRILCKSCGTQIGEVVRKKTNDENLLKLNIKYTDHVKYNDFAVKDDCGFIAKNKCKFCSVSKF